MIRTKLDKDCPCTKDCAERTATCHSTCEAYLKYRARKDADCDARLKTFDMDGYSTAGAKRAIREAAKDRKRGWR